MYIEIVWDPFIVGAVLGFAGGVASTFMVMWPKLASFKAVAESHVALEVVEEEAA